MQETGKIIEIMGSTAKVEVSQKEVCHKCPSESFCKLATGGSRSIEAVNEMGAKVGDTVKIEIGSGNILVSAFFVYIFPIIALLVVGGFVQSISGSQNMAIVTGIIALGASFLIVHLLDKKMNKSKQLIPAIKEIINEEVGHTGNS